MTGRALLVTTMALVVFVRTALWVLPSRITLSALRTLAAAEPRRRVAALPTLEALTSAVVAASRRVPRATCLTQAVAAQLLLHFFGYRSTLEVGVARDDGGALVAHAWLEQDGRIVIGGDASRSFTRLVAFDRTAAGANTRGALDG